MTHTIISKRLSTFTYQQWTFQNGQYVPVGKGVLINGGAGIVGGSDLLSGRPLEKRGMFVPGGVTTEVSDEVLEYLMGCWKFKDDIKRGLVVVLKNQSIDQGKADKIAEKEMESDENLNDRPFTDKDIEAAGGKINRDGSIDITEAQEDIDLVRRRNAGQPFYIKERNKAEAKAKRARKTTKK